QDVFPHRLPLGRGQSLTRVVEGRNHHRFSRRKFVQVIAYGAVEGDQVVPLRRTGLYVVDFKGEIPSGKRGVILISLPYIVGQCVGGRRFVLEPRGVVDVVGPPVIVDLQPQIHLRTARICRLQSTFHHVVLCVLSVACQRGWENSGLLLAVCSPLNQHLVQKRVSHVLELVPPLLQGPAVTQCRLQKGAAQRRASALALCTGHGVATKNENQDQNARNG